jgi:hypothetical protein
MTFVSPELYSGPDFALEAVKLYSEVICNCQINDLVKYKEVVLEAVKRDHMLWHDVGSGLLYDLDVLVEVVGGEWRHLERIPETKHKREIVSGAVKKKGLALKFTSSLFQDDREIVLKAVKHCGPALKIFFFEIAR